MILYLMRHGEAVSAEEWRGGEATRPLARRGEKALEAAAKEWTRLRFAPQTILTSPLARAQQTASYVGRATSIPITTIPELTAGVKPDVLRSTFLQTQWPWPILYVGHMPDLAYISSRLTHEASLLETVINTGEMLAFEAEGSETGWGAWRLLWRRQLDEWKKLKEVLL